MKIKGIEKFREKIPMLGGKKIFFLPAYWFLILTSSLLVMRGFDALPGKLASSGMSRILCSFMPLLGVAIMSVVGLMLVWQMWFWRKRLRSACGALSYQRIALVGFAGVACVMSLSVHQYFCPLFFPRSFWLDAPLGFLTVTPEAFFGSWSALIWGIRIFLAACFFMLGIGMVLRSVQTFGLDYMAVIYLYFPEESHVQDHAIYSVLRHPAYTGFIVLGLGGTFAAGTLYALVFLIMLVLTFYTHVHFVEEKELLERFGPSYKEYMQKVPAFFVKPNNWGVLLEFLLGKKG
jgi:protein-S-isoprenylcysteine O-methyltransferase Ste14